KVQLLLGKNSGGGDRTHDLTGMNRTLSPAELRRHQVGKTGFEPATPWSQTKCSTKLSYFPLNKNNKIHFTLSNIYCQENYAPKRSRISNRLIRSQVLYPIELWVHIIKIVPRAGVEPARVQTTRGILSPVRLPIPPPRHNIIPTG